MPHFSRLFIMSFKHGVTLSSYSLTDTVSLLSPLLVFIIIVTPKITYSNWFIIIFFFFLLKKILNIFNYFSFFSSPKRLLISLIMFPSSGLGFSIIICYEENLYFFKKKLMMLLKKHSKILSFK